MTGTCGEILSRDNDFITVFRDLVGLICGRQWIIYYFVTTLPSTFKQFMGGSKHIARSNKKKTKSEQVCCNYFNTVKDLM